MAEEAKDELSRRRYGRLAREWLDKVDGLEWLDGKVAAHLKARATR